MQNITAYFSETILYIDADYIVTCNVRDYEHSIVPAITPMDFLEQITIN